MTKQMKKPQREKSYILSRNRGKNMIYDEIIKVIKPENVKINEKMSKHTSFRVGGVADFFVTVKDVTELVYLLKIAKQLKNT